MAVPTSYRTQVLAELEAIPDEYLPYLIQVVRSFRESVSLKSATASFRQGWQEAHQGETYPVATLWNDIDAE
jgi:hypothetical protein